MERNVWHIVDHFPGQATPEKEQSESDSDDVQRKKYRCQYEETHRISTK